MLDNTYDITLGDATVTLNRQTDQNNESVYFGEDGNDKITLYISHTIPKAGNSGESHLVRLDVEHYDDLGLYVRTSSAWQVMKTLNASQDTARLNEVNSALSGLNTAAFAARLALRES